MMEGCVSNSGDVPGGDATVSVEATRLHAVLEGSTVAFSYFDASDRLIFWNKAYENLNFAIRHLVVRGAYFPDMLAELVLNAQISVSGSNADWLEKRLRARRTGETAFRKLTDGRTFLVQERKDEVGGTLGFWLDITDLFNTGALTSSDGGISGSAEAAISAHGTQDAIRNQLQVVLGNLELLRLQRIPPDQAPLVNDAFAAAKAIGVILDAERG